MMHVHSCQIPPESQIASHVPGAQFADCYRVQVKNESKTALGHFLSAAASTPEWVEVLMRLRNRVGGLVGLKNLGTLGAIDRAKPESAYVAGDRVGVFTLRSNTPDEVVVADNDKHLEVLLSLVRHPTDPDGKRYVSLSTVVHVHNMLGTIYMLPVGPLHKLIAPAVLARIGA